MSRIGKKIIDIPEGVNITINESEILTTGPKGELSCENFSGTNVVQENNQITIAPVDESQASIQYWGIQRTLLNNNIVGVTEGYKKILEINPDHKLIKKLAKMSKDKASVGDIENIGILLYEQSMILDGEKPSDPVNFSKKLIDTISASIS